MEQGQDLGRAAPDVFVRLRRWSPSRLPRHTGMRHGLKGTGLVLTPDCSATIWMRGRVASRRNAPELIVRCLTPMFPTVTLAQGRLVEPDRAWVTPCSRTPAPAPSHSARPSGDAGPCAADGRDNSPDTRPAADRAAHVPFATDRRRTRLAAAPSPQ